MSEQKDIMVWKRNRMSKNNLIRREYIENEIAEHIIKVDDNIEMRVKIPKKLDAIEFTSILEKARKILKLSEITVSTGITDMRKKGIKRIKGAYTNRQEDKIKLIKEYESTERSEIDQMAIKYGYKNSTSLEKAIYRFKKQIGAGERIRKKYQRSANWENGKEKELIRLVRQGMSYEKIAKKFGVSKKQVYDKVYGLKKRGKI